MNVNYKHKWFYELARYSYFFVGNAELLFLIGLSLIGERENIRELSNIRFFVKLWN